MWNSSARLSDREFPMARYHSPKEYLEEASSPATTAERLDILAESQWEFVRAAVAAHPNVAPLTLAGLVPTGARPLDESIAVAIARRSNAPVDALRKLAIRFGRMVNWSGRAVGFDLGLALLSNPASPDDVVVELLDPERSTRHFRMRVASTTTRADVLERLQQDRSEAVQKRAKNRTQEVARQTVSANVPPLPVPRERVGVMVL
jgi:hypothetical protein